MVNLNYLYNPIARKAQFEKNCFADKKLGFSVIENGAILPHKQGIPGREFWGGAGIVDSKGKYISNSYIHAGWGISYTPPRTNAIQFGNRHLFGNVLPCLGTCLNR